MFPIAAKSFPHLFSFLLLQLSPFCTPSLDAVQLADYIGIETLKSALIYGSPQDWSELHRLCPLQWRSAKPKDEVIGDLLFSLGLFNRFDAIRFITKLAHVDDFSLLSLLAGAASTGDPGLIERAKEELSSLLTFPLEERELDKIIFTAALNTGNITVRITLFTGPIQLLTIFIACRAGLPSNGPSAPPLPSVINHRGGTTCAYHHQVA